MKSIVKHYEIFTAVEFSVSRGVNLTEWVNDDGKTIPRMEGIYPTLVSEADLLKHLAFNAVVNGVRDASALDGYADLPLGALTMRVVHTETEIEES